MQVSRDKHSEWPNSRCEPCQCTLYSLLVVYSDGGSSLKRTPGVICCMMSASFRLETHPGQEIHTHRNVAIALLLIKFDKVPGLEL